MTRVQSNLVPLIKNCTDGSFVSFMTNQERREQRYQRRKENRRVNYDEWAFPYRDFNNVFTYENLYRAYKLCKRGVNWKGSTQKYSHTAMTRVANTLEELRNDTFRTKGFYEFDIIERGKPRHIQSVNISERVVQRCLCDFSLTPLIQHSLIYDNGASQRHKGVDFALNRIIEHLQTHVNKYGNEGYVLLYDFRHYFESIPHDKIYAMIDALYGGDDNRLGQYVKYFVSNFGGTHGVGLGSQISQSIAIGYVNSIDHHIKDTLSIHGYGRYMDDGYIIHHDRQILEKFLIELNILCKELGIELNKKTQIVKLSKGFNFLKHRFFITENNKVVCTSIDKNAYAAKRKYRKLKTKVDEGIMKYEDVHVSINSFLGHLVHRDTYKTRKIIIQFFCSLFKEYRHPINDS